MQKKGQQKMANNDMSRLDCVVVVGKVTEKEDYVIIPYANINEHLNQMNSGAFRADPR